MSNITSTSLTTPVITSYEVRVVRGSNVMTAATCIADLNAGIAAMTDWLKHCQQPGDRVELIAIQKECIKVIGTLMKRVEQKKGYQAYQAAANIVPIRAGKVNS